MKSKGSVVFITKMLYKFGMIGLLLLTYLINLTPDQSFHSHSDSAEKTTVFFDEADPEFSFDTEIDLIDESIKNPYSNPFLLVSSNNNKPGIIGSQAFSAVHLEILIPPPRLNS